jgi:phosphoheptose isomerase
VTVLCEDASALILVAANGIVPDEALPVLKVLTCRVVSRALDNPQGFTAETVGSYSYSREAVGAVGLELTPGEVAQVANLAGVPQTASPKIGLGIDRCDRAQLTAVSGWGLL